MARNNMSYAISFCDRLDEAVIGQIHSNVKALRSLWETAVSSGDVRAEEGYAKRIAVEVETYSKITGRPYDR